MRVCVSACLLGRACKYNGGDNLDEALVRAIDLAGDDVVAVCPEVAGGLPTPRPRSEIRAGRVVNELGESVDRAFREGARREMARIGSGDGVDIAVLQPRSPSCGRGRIYDGTFSGILVSGDGVFARLLLERGIEVLEPSEYIARAVAGGRSGAVCRGREA